MDVNNHDKPTRKHYEETYEFGIEAELLDDAGILATSKLAVILRLGTGDDHFATGENQGGRLGLTDTHDDGSETLRVVLGITGVQSNRLEVKSTIEVNRGNDVLQGGYNAGNLWVLLVTCKRNMRRITSSTHALGLLLPRRGSRSNRLLNHALLLPIHSIPVRLLRLTVLGIRRRRSEMAGSAGVGKRVGTCKGRSLFGVIRVRDVCLLHDCDGMRGYQTLKRCRDSVDS